MIVRREFFKLFLIATLLAMLTPCVAASAAEKGVPKDGVKVAGIMFDFDLKAHWITVKADGEDGPIKYLFDPADKRLTDVLAKTVFPASRVQLTYKIEGDTRRLVSIKRQVLKAAGTVTGIVVKVHNEFWIELKPKNGHADAFAPGANYNDKAFMARLKALKPGDSVTIQFITDFERHRIETLRKHEDSKP